MTRTITPTHVLLSQITLGAATTTINFSNIPQNYGDLVLVINSTLETFTSGNGKGASVIRFNSDAGSNYTHVQMSGDQNGPLSTSGTQTYVDLFISSYEDDVVPTIYRISIFDYAQTDKHKAVLSRGDLATGNQYPRTALNTYRWASTSAITSMSIFSVVSGGLYNVGSTFSLYGVHA